MEAVNRTDGEPIDRRVRRTRRLLAQALLSLVLERGCEEVTVREITECADVGYTTFFRHYFGKDALLEEVLEVVLDDLPLLLGPVQAKVQAAYPFFGTCRRTLKRAGCYWEKELRRRWLVRAYE